MHTAHTEGRHKSERQDARNAIPDVAGDYKVFSKALRGCLRTPEKDERASAAGGGGRKVHPRHQLLEFLVAVERKELGFGL